MTTKTKSDKKISGIVASVGSLWITDSTTNPDLFQSSANTIFLDKYRVILDSSLSRTLSSTIPNTNLCEVELLKISYSDLLFDAFYEKSARKINDIELAGLSDKEFDIDKLAKTKIEIEKISAKTILDLLNNLNLDRQVLVSAVLIIVVEDLEKTKAMLKKLHGRLVKEVKLQVGSYLVFNVLFDHTEKATDYKFKIIQSENRYKRIPVIILPQSFWDPIAILSEQQDSQIDARPFPRWEIRSLLESLLILDESQMLNLTLRSILNEVNDIVLNLPKGTDLEPNERLASLLSAHERLAVFEHVRFLTRRWIQVTENRLRLLFSSISSLSDKMRKFSIDLEITEDQFPFYIVENLEPALKDWLVNSQQLIRSRAEIEKLAVEERRAILEEKKEEKYNRISNILGTLVIFEIFATLLSWALPEVTIEGWIWWGILILTFLFILSLILRIRNEKQV